MFEVFVTTPKNWKIWCGVNYWCFAGFRGEINGAWLHHQKTLHARTCTEVKSWGTGDRISQWCPLLPFLFVGTSFYLLIRTLRTTNLLKSGFNRNKTSKRHYHQLQIITGRGPTLVYPYSSSVETPNWHHYLCHIYRHKLKILHLHPTQQFYGNTIEVKEQYIPPLMYG